MMDIDRTVSSEELARTIRIRVLRMSYRAKSSHVGSALSIADILAVLYNQVIHIGPKFLDSPDRDRFILSKGHACAALYAVLSEIGIIPREWLDSYQDDGSRLARHVDHTVPGVEVSTGSLGHGLAIGCGMALSGKRDNRLYRVFALLSDGECDEGSTWESILFASHHKLDNLVAIVDYNKLQAFGRVKEVLNLEPLAEKWRIFGWSAREIDGHDFKQIADALDDVPFDKNLPSCIIANTIKGKGVSFMENQIAWHYLYPDKEQLQQALKELGINELET